MKPKSKDYFFSFLSVFVNISSNIIMVPLYVKYFGTIDFGIWIVISTILQYLTLASFGLPTALTTLSTNAPPNENIVAIFNKSLRIMCLIALSLVSITSMAYMMHLIPYNFFFGKSNDTQFYGVILVSSVILYLIRSPFQLSSSIFLILGKVDTAKKYEIFTNLSIPVSFAITYLTEQNIIAYAIIWGMLLLINSLIMYVHARYELYNYINKSELKRESNTSYPQIIKTSLGYFIISLGAILVWNSDNLVIVNFLGVENVTPFSLTFRIFTAFFAVLMTVNSVMLPFYGKFASTGDIAAIQKNFNNSILIMTVLSGSLCVFILIFNKDIFILWTKNEALYIGTNIFLVFGLYTYILSCLNAISTLLSALKKIKILVIATFVEAAVNLTVSIALVRSMGLTGVAVGTLTGSLVSLTLICIFFKAEIGLNLHIPMKLMLKNAVLIVVTCATLLLIHNQVTGFLIKVVFFTAFIAVYFSANFRSILSLKIKNES